MSDDTRLVWERKYIHIVWIGESASGKTDIYRVYSKTNIAPLGEVKWYTPWRKYVFAPGNITLYDSNCLNEIIEFLEKTNREHKNIKITYET